MVIVTPDYLASTPRVVKEADALAESGLRVAVVFGEGPIARHRASDAALARGRPWTSLPLRWSPRGGPLEAARHVIGGARVRAAGLVGRRLGGFALAALASCRLAPELAVRAAALPARLYIGHYPGGLVAAAAAARLRGALLGYDAEDLHLLEPDPGGGGRPEVVRRIERRLLPRCATVTASSEPIAAALGREYGIPGPLVVHNAFPWADRAALDGRRLDRRAAERRSATWFSQTIGLERGLPDAIAALASTVTPWELHLRGSCAPDVRARLERLARASGVADRLHVHPPVPPGELLSRVAEHDVGLALEQPDRPDYDLACPNKVFTYLLAGLPVVATSTRGQASVLGLVGEAARLVPPGSAKAIAAGLDDLAARLDDAKAAALEAARSRWCWERESRPHVERVRALLGEGR